MTQPVCGSLKRGSMESFDNVKIEKSTKAPNTRFSPVFHSGSMAELTTNVGYSASKVLWAKYVRKQLTLAARVMSSNEKSASFCAVRIGNGRRG